MSYKRYWVALAIVIIGSFAVLGGVGRKMISEAPPLPDVYTTDGQLLFTGSSITDGQGVWQSIGGQEIGTVWGHGAYVAPDWSADWLHRESEILLNTWAARSGSPNFAALEPDQQAVFKARLIRDMRTNTYDAPRNRVTIDPDRAAAFEQLKAYYTDVFATGRSEYAIPQGALTNPPSSSNSRRSSGGPHGQPVPSVLAPLPPIPITGRMSPWSTTCRPPDLFCGAFSASSVCWQVLVALCGGTLRRRRNSFMALIRRATRSLPFSRLPHSARHSNTSWSSSSSGAYRY